MRINGIPINDTICDECDHWFEEHDEGGKCRAPDCACMEFNYGDGANTPEAIADRGGDPERWPEHVKAHFRGEGGAAAKRYTVFALYADNLQRYATSVEAESPEEAERIVRNDAEGELLVAGVIEGSHPCLDPTYAIYGADTP